MTKLERWMKDIEAATKTHMEVFQDESLLTNTVEELGEYAAASSVERGRKPHKVGTLKESAKQESVDVIICAISLFFAEGGKVEELIDYGNTKLKKWHDRMKKRKADMDISIPIDDLTYDKLVSLVSKGQHSSDIMWEKWEPLSYDDVMKDADKAGNEGRYSLHYNSSQISKEVLHELTEKGYSMFQPTHEKNDEITISLWWAPHLDKMKQHQMIDKLGQFAWFTPQLQPTGE